MSMFSPRFANEGYYMAIPDFQSIMLPLMQYCRDGREHNTIETADALAATFKLTGDERNALLPSGVQKISEIWLPI